MFLFFWADFEAKHSVTKISGKDRRLVLGIQSHRKFQKAKLINEIDSVINDVDLKTERLTTGRSLGQNLPERSSLFASCGKQSRNEILCN